MFDKDPDSVSGSNHLVQGWAPQPPPSDVTTGFFLCVFFLWCFFFAFSFSCWEIRGFFQKKLFIIFSLPKNKLRSEAVTVELHAVLEPVKINSNPIRGCGQWSRLTDVSDRSEPPFYCLKSHTHSRKLVRIKSDVDDIKDLFLHLYEYYDIPPNFS